MNFVMIFGNRIILWQFRLLAVWVKLHRQTPARGKIYTLIEKTRANWKFTSAGVSQVYRKRYHKYNFVFINIGSILIYQRRTPISGPAPVKCLFADRKFSASFGADIRVNVFNVRVLHAFPMRTQSDWPQNRWEDAYREVHQDQILLWSIIV